MKVVFDFDNTLFDTEKKKDLFRKIAQVHGYSAEQARELYQMSRNEGRSVVLSLSRYVACVRSKVLEDGKEFLSKEVSCIIEDMNKGDGLLPGAKQLIGYCRHKKFDRYVLSLGEKTWQEEKVQQSGIRHFFEEDNIIFTDDEHTGKVDSLKSLFGSEFEGEDMILFNDKPNETKCLLEAFPKLIALIRRELRDLRYSQDDFDQLTKQFGERVHIHNDLYKLTEVLQNTYDR